MSGTTFPGRLLKKAGACCPLREWGKSSTFYLYEFPVFDSVPTVNSERVKFFSQFSNESGFVAMRAKIAWNHLPLTGDLEKAAEKFSNPCGGQKAFDLYFLSKGFSADALWCKLHGHVWGGGMSVLEASLHRKPPRSVKVPAHIQRCSDDLGGYPNGLKVMFDTLVVGRKTCRANADLLSLLPLGSAFKAQRNSFKRSVGPFHAVDQQTTWKKRDGSTAAVDFFKGGESVEVDSKLSLAPSIECFDTACELLLKKIQPLLKSK